MQYRHIAYIALPMLAFAAGAATSAPAAAQTTDSGLPVPIQTVQQTVIVAPAAPPPPQTETVPPPPAAEGQQAFWQPGHWAWTSAGWVWAPGSYAWVPGQWMTQPSGGYVWVDGHWQS
jgi:hypothetical protein